MDFCGLSEKLLEEAERSLTYDPNIPFQFRVMSCVIYDNDYDTARRLLEANKGEFDGEYGYLVLDFAVEMCINITVDHIVAVGALRDLLPKRLNSLNTSYITAQTRTCRKILIRLNISTMLKRTAVISAAVDLTAPRLGSF